MVAVTVTPERSVGGDLSRQQRNFSLATTMISVYYMVSKQMNRFVVPLHGFVIGFCTQTEIDIFIATNGCMRKMNLECIVFVNMHYIALSFLI